MSSHVAPSRTEISLAVRPSHAPAPTPGVDLILRAGPVLAYFGQPPISDAHCRRGIHLRAGISMPIVFAGVSRIQEHHAGQPRKQLHPCCELAHIRHVHMGFLPDGQRASALHRRASTFFMGLWTADEVLGEQVCLCVSGGFRSPSRISSEHSRK